MSAEWPSISPAASRKLARLKTPLHTMEHEEALALIHSLRARRDRPQAPLRVRAASAEKPAKKKRAVKPPPDEVSLLEALQRSVEDL